jgi:hypothetical protein
MRRKKVRAARQCRCDDSPLNEGAGSAAMVALQHRHLPQYATATRPPTIGPRPLVAIEMDRMTHFPIQNTGDLAR